MRTTIDIENDVLAATKEMASRQRVSVGTVISRLLREAMSGTTGVVMHSAGGPRPVAGLQPFPSQGVLITNAHIDALREIEDV